MFFCCTALKLNLHSVTGSIEQTNMRLQYPDDTLGSPLLLAMPAVVVHRVLAPIAKLLKCEFPNIYHCYFGYKNVVFNVENAFFH